MPERLKSPLLAIFLFLANVYVCRELFGIEYLRHMGSIEAAYIGISRYAIGHWRDLSWFPLWYNGIPYQNTYPPLLHWGVALVASMRGMMPAHAYHWTIALAYCLGPVTLFLLVQRLSGSRWAGFMAGLFYTVLTPSAWLMPDIERALGSPFRPQRLNALVYWGEGPHVSAMTLLPVAFLLVDLAIRKRRVYSIAGAAFALAAVVLTNWLAAFALALGMVAYLLAGLDFSGSHAHGWRRLLLPMVAIGAAAYGLAMPWAPPSTIAVTQYNARFVVGDFRTVYQTLPEWSVAIICGLAFLKLATRKFSIALQFAVFFTFLTALITLADDWFHKAIVPQPERYHLEMEMGIAMLLALVGYEVFRRAPQKIAMGAMIALVIVLIPPLRICRRYARTFLVTTIDITHTSEWKTADWLNRNWSGERVMLPGSSMFWLTAFSDTPQIGGGFAQGITDRELPVATYGLTAGAGEHWAEWSVMWLKALGVQAVGVSGPGSTEVYKDFVDPRKFEGTLEPLWRDGGDVLYRVGRPHTSLARVVPRNTLVPRTPVNGADVDPLRAYVAALDDPSMPEARFSWTSAHSAQIATDLGPGQVVSWQEAWHAGWHARVGGKDIPIARDALGMMTIYPHSSGPCTIDLSYDGGIEMRVATWISGMTALVLLGMVVVGIFRSNLIF
jgi:hypothetical protein